VLESMFPMPAVVQALRLLLRNSNRSAANLLTVARAAAELYRRTCMIGFLPLLLQRHGLLKPSLCNRRTDSGWWHPTSVAALEDRSIRTSCTGSPAVLTDRSSLTADVTTAY